MIEFRRAEQPARWGRVLFAEDVRVEASGQFSIIGCYPEGVSVAKFPAFLPKLAIYIEVVEDASLPTFFC